MDDVSHTMSHKRLLSTSMKNSKVASNKSFHHRTQKEYSFQDILKDMNNRVLLSRQTKNSVFTLEEDNLQGENVKKCDFTTDREQRKKRLAKTHYVNKST
jgi:hypothetical protein